MTHYTDPTLANAHVLICYRNFQRKNPAYLHIGLGVNALHTAKTLRAAKIRTDIHPIWDAVDLKHALAHRPTVTHVVIEAPFIGGNDLIPVLHAYADIHFICRCHSNIGFLQVEASAINLIREYLGIQDQFLNFRLAVNSVRLGTFLQEVYNGTVALLPNLYFVDHPRVRNWNPLGKVIRAGSFGSIRLQKNHITSAAAALMMAHVHNRDLEFFISVGREEHGRGTVQAISNMFTHLRWAKLIELPWDSWTNFRSHMSTLDIHFQLSMSETFNIVTADAVAEGIPTVVGESVDWAPPDWVAEIDDPKSAADKGWSLLNNPNAGKRGLHYLQDHNKHSLVKWEDWITGHADTMVDYHLR